MLGYGDPRTIYKLHANNTFVSIVAPEVGSDFDNVILEFVEYDKNTKKKLNEIDIYYTIPEFLSLCHMIIDRTVINMIKADKANCKAKNIKYSSSKLFPTRGGGEENGVTKYRESYFRCSSLDTMDGMLAAERCDGYRDKDKKINPKKEASRETIRVAFLFPELYNMAAYGLQRIQAFIIAQQMAGCFSRSTSFNSSSEENTIKELDQVASVEPSVSPVYSPVSYQGNVPDNTINPDEQYYQQYMMQYGM